MRCSCGGLIVCHVWFECQAQLWLNAQTVEQHRQLLAEPDPVPPLLSNLTQLLREELNNIKRQWNQQWKDGENKLKDDGNWMQLEKEQRECCAKILSVATVVCVGTAKTSSFNRLTMASESARQAIQYGLGRTAYPPPRESCV